jgi:hypothetical protein
MTMTVALLDRHIHLSHMLMMEGVSFNHTLSPFSSEWDR